LKDQASRRTAADTPTSDRRPRGIRTRRKMLDVLKELLASRSVRDVKVVDITEAVGVSPAAFYQYFPDLRTALLALAEEMVEDAKDLPQLVLGDWESDSRKIAEQLVDGFLDFWERHSSIINVVELAIDEHDPEFNRIRAAMLSETHIALGFVLANLQKSGARSSEVNPRAAAAAILASIIHVASRRWLYKRWNNVSMDELRDGLVELVFTMVAGPAPAIATE